MGKITVGCRVRGKTKKYQGKVGVVSAVHRVSRQHSYDVTWTNGSQDTVAARAIELERRASSENTLHEPPNLMQDPAYTSFSELLRESNAAIVADFSSSSNSSAAEDTNASSSSDEQEEDDTVIAHGRRWKPCHSVLFDQGSHVQPRPTRFYMGALDGSTIAKYFYLMYPMPTLKSTLACTNANLAMQSHRQIKVGDWFKWIGLRLAMAVEPRSGPLRVYWESECKEGFVGTPANFGQRYGMTRHCFEQVLYCMSFTSDPTAEDPWKPIRPIVDGFNERRKRVVNPGNILCIDECMSAWKGRESKYCHDGLPHKTKIARKPEGKGTEIKSIADGQSGVLLGLELVEGAVRQREKLYAREYGEGTSVVLRLSEHYRGTGRTIVADSAFASVKTLVQLENRLGLFFMGMVKTASVEYPKKHLLEWFNTAPRRGDFKVFSSTTEHGNQMYAICWADRKPMTIISNRGTTLPGSDSVRTRHRLIERNGLVETMRYEKRISRPQMVELFFSDFSTIDIHDHYRQGSLAIEREWITRNWTHRLFSTILGMIVVDAFLAYRYDMSNREQVDGEDCSFQGFVSQLAHQLIFNDYEAVRTTRSGTAEVAECDGETHPRHQTIHRAPSLCFSANPRQEGSTSLWYVQHKVFILLRKLFTARLELVFRHMRTPFWSKVLQ
ncbi:hypothetical protein AM588_10008680 [Phytophthora nicotianae]|uniref:PiggyBac transposable element-derived protein domain-containing protein n=1 Tax=Phytophthora nicotianae TaxID=4792 RepID=A0A0W8DTI1_PHYNI|nr:hypothetical protein AM588_10008680 [Phytophthora nicotianae]